MSAWVDPDTHGWITSPRTDADWDALIGEYGGPLSDPFKRIVEVVRAGGCRTVVIENRYVDLDYRSEYSAFWSLRFQSPPPFARRIHFFSEEISDDRVHDLPDNPGYLGYSVIRPLQFGRVGRTLLTPPPDLARATFADVEDEISLFGNRLTVTGVPFCQQDVEYLRCAHAAAWVCHYVAARRGLVGRRATAEIVDLSPTMLSPERALPSKGMTLNQLQAVFGELGQPALFYGLSSLPKVPGVPDPNPAVDPDGNELPAGCWDKRVISVICRYLNSKFPVLIGAQDHAFILTGWYRDGDEIRFVASDDQVGPYGVIESPFSHYKTPWDSIMIPLPPKVFLSAEAAETAAYRAFRSVTAGNLLSWLGDALDAGQIQLRTMLREGKAFKDEVSRQASTDEVLRATRLARLPHWVWVVEAHDTTRCGSEDECVVATAVYDSTSFDLAPLIEMLALPGLVVIFPPDGGTQVRVPGSAEPWRSLLR